MQVRVREDADSIRDTTPLLLGKVLNVIDTWHGANGVAVDVMLPNGRRGILFSSEYDLYRL